VKLINPKETMNQRLWKAAPSYAVTGGREKGRQLRKVILSDLEACPPDTTLLVDLGAIRTLDFSAADEVVGGLIGRVLSGEMGTRRFALTGLGESARDSIAAVLELRKRQCLEVLSDGHVNVLGPLNPVHKETLQFVVKRGEVSVADVADHFRSDLSMPAATNRLNTLADAGLVVRRAERGGPRGNRFVYAAVVVAGSRRDRPARSRAIAIKPPRSSKGESPE
jgi:predicted transcriptional regulator